MTTLEKKMGNAITTPSLNEEIIKLIESEGAGTGLDGLLNFESKVGNKDIQLSPSEIQTILEEIKNDIQNPDFLSFESGEREGKDFGFEGVGIDVIPTLSPNGDCIIPVNFRYNGQRRTILLVLEVENNGEHNIYRLPEGDNRYNMKIDNIEFTYQLIANGATFRMEIKK